MLEYLELRTCFSHNLSSSIIVLLPILSVCVLVECCSKAKTCSISSMTNDTEQSTHVVIVTVKNAYETQIS